MLIGRAPSFNLEALPIAIFYHRTSAALTSISFNLDTIKQ